MQSFCTFFSVVLLLLAAIACGSKPSAVETVEIDPEFLRNFQPAPEAMLSEKNPLTEEKVALGRMLYYETRLSKNHDISCNTCHLLDRYGVDNLPTSKGHKGQRGARNAPSTYHAAAHVVQFWDGRAADVEEQAKGPVTNPIEMAMRNADEVAAVLVSMPEYVTAFQRAFPGEKQPVTLDHAAAAIAAFERKLVTRSRWDKFLGGDGQALTNEEKAGFLAFYKAGCQACHNGPEIGGRLYQRVGLVKPWPNQKDQGRFEATHKEHDRMVFKAPSLRNIEKTAPYFHDGGTASLEDAVRMMGEHQVERPLTDTETRRIVAWLRTLTGEIPAGYIAPPELPKSTASTPKPAAD